MIIMTKENMWLPSCAAMFLIGACFVLDDLDQCSKFTIFLCGLRKHFSQEFPRKTLVPSKAFKFDCSEKI